MRVFGLIGYPLTHSFSGTYFEKKFRDGGLSDHAYHLYPLPNLNGFTEWVRGIEGLVGLNVTIPYKKSILPFLEETRLPDGLQACNCIHVESGKLIGYNTDVIGFKESIKPLLKSHHNRALVLGYGGAAEAVRHALHEWQIPFETVVRERKASGQILYEELTEQIVEQHPLIINTTPLGTYPNVDQYPPIPYEGVGEQHLLYDLVYNPARTAFLKKGEARGAVIFNGLSMLILQAEAAWSIWNGNSIVSGGFLHQGQ